MCSGNCVVFRSAIPCRNVHGRNTSRLMKLWKKLIVAVDTLEAALPNALITATQKNAATISTMPKNSCRVILRASDFPARLLLSLRNAAPRSRARPARPQTHCPTKDTLRFAPA